ncbi:MAG TPA: leucyl aminopeptidase family protein [Acidimicrobiales bacterium]|jgi:leucyl aminopeptidase|nr:leucyl aminopeptidase family protein [Acidimicrobiales bacterium]
MTRTARISSIKEALTQSTIAVPVLFSDGVGTISDAIPQSLAGQEIPRVLTKEWCARQGFKGDVGGSVVLRSLHGSNVAFVSVGSSDQDANAYRLAGAGVLRATGEGSIAFLLPTDGLRDPAGVAQALVEGALLASYSFKNQSADASFDVVPIGVPLPTVAVHDDVTRGVERGVTIADAVNWAKFLVDSPAGFMSPKALANEIDERLELDEHVTVEIWNESKIKEERLGGLLGVGQGSAQPTRLVYATYDPLSGGGLAHVALVGKGVTFDSGGLSIKSGDGMMNMKTDMTGAAVVMAVLSLASRLKLNVRVSAIAPLTENLLGDRATKPGDVLTIRNGMTIEVLNTDAEGRLILADGLSLAAEMNPDAIIDVATLTGAQNVALGDEVGAMFVSNDELAERLAAASGRSGEALWRMPLVDSYETHIESDVADMKNIGKPPKAGSISAALLLRRFTDGRPWAHLDIAGPARSDAARGFVTKGATAFSTRTLVEYLVTLSDGVKN